MNGILLIENRRIDVDEIIKRHTTFVNWDVVHYSPKWIKTPMDYNKYLTKVDFWQQLPYDNVLIIQHDSGLLHGNIEPFMEYDFIGAPIKYIDFPAMNGGLSFRKKDAMIKCLKNVDYNPSIHGNEDIYFCNVLNKIGGRLPSFETAKSFSVETVFSLGTFGYHAPEKYLSENELQQIFSYNK